MQRDRLHDLPAVRLRLDHLRPALPHGPYLVVGLARSGLAAGRLLVAHGEQVVGVDAGTPDVGHAGFQTHLGVEGLDQLAGAAAVVKSPGVPPGAAVIAAAHERGLPVLGELELAWRLIDAPFVAVTGTNGKTTVCEWIGHVHRVAGVAVAVAGNVGTPLSTLAGTTDTVVCECSSFQLHDTIAFRPDVGVLLNVGSDHLDWHGGLAAYQEAKRRVLQADRPIGPGLPPDVGAVGLPGAHNRANARFVAAACRARDIPEPAIAEGLRTFRGVEHRLEDVGERDGVRYVNDSKATNVEAALVALDAFGEAAIHLVAGGDDAKQEDFTPLRAPVIAHCASVHLIGAAAGRLRAALGKGELCADLEQAVAAARARARPGDVVLLAPACASYDQFANFEQRGERFKELVR